MKTLPPVRQVVLAVTQLAELHPNAIIGNDGDGCFYFNPDGTCSCIVGHAFGQLGLVAADFNEHDNSNNVMDLYNAQGVPLDDDDLRWLANVQEAQDEGTSWGNAIGFGGYDDDA